MRSGLYSIVLILTPLLFCSRNSNPEIPGLPYFGQDPPGMTPEVFAPGIISKTGNHLHSCVTISPDGKEIYFTYRVFEPALKNTIFFMKQKSGGWTRPVVAPFSGRYDDDSAVFSPDGKRLFFSYSRPIDSSDESDDLNFWYVERKGIKWSKPVYAGDSLNNDSCDFRLSIAHNGTVYLSSDRAYSGRKAFDIFVSDVTDGNCSIPIKMDDAVNTPETEQIGFVAPDERYIIFYRYAPDHREDMGLYISFRKEDGAWTPGRNMGPLFNDPPESCTQAASLSPDGDYIFFLRRFEEAIYWVDARVIDNLRYTDLKE